MAKAKTTKPKYPGLQKPVMAAKCKSCPFQEANRCTGTAEAVTARVLTAGSQMCHTSGWPEGTHLCRGARDVQLTVMHRLGLLAEPADEAWDAKRKELNV